MTTYAQRVERDRRQDETAARMVILAMTARAARHAVMAAELGHDPASAARAALDGTADRPGLADRLAPVMIAAWDKGWRRAGLAAGLPLSHPYYGEDEGLRLDTRPRALPAARARLTARARGIASDVAQVVARGLGSAVASAGRGVNAVVRAVKRWWRKSGMVASNHPDARIGPDGKPVDPTRRTKQIAAEAVIQAGNEGADEGFSAEAGADLTGYRFSAVVDNVTTPVCRACAGVKLPPDHPWWQTHTPRMHWGCRSLRIPLFTEFIPTPNPPIVQPAPGFGTPIVVTPYAFA